MGKKFNKLAKHIEREYEKKGYSVEESKYIGKATAGRIARMKKRWYVSKTKGQISKLRKSFVWRSS